MTVTTIKKPDTDPIVALLLTLFVIQIGHYVINGQQRKWLFCLLGVFIGGAIFVLPGLFMNVFSTVDACQTAERLKKGETIGENEYTLPLLYKIVKIVDSEATCSAVVD